jgi:hypothetical protein
MLFWKNNSTQIDNQKASIDVTQQLNKRLEVAQHNLLLARRRVLGAAVLLSLSCAFLPWVLDSTKRPWGEDVILRMPKNDIPYPNSPVKSVNQSSGTIDLLNSNSNLVKDKGLQE